MKSGVILINKPQGFTSFDVIAKCRGILKERRLGHSGTLDPMATGVLPVFIGKATKACDILPDNEKLYRAEFKLGYSTDTQDTTGKILLSSDKRVSKENILTALESFKGEIMQLPPMYSAVKVDGKRLYDLAREGKTVERKARPITVYGITLESFDEPSQAGVLNISCSKGTYIRTIINDLGEVLGTYGVMSGLVRTSSSGFTLDRCITLDELQTLADKCEAESLVIPVDECFRCYPEIRLSGKQAAMYKNGIKLDLAKLGVTDEGIFRVYGDEFLGLARADIESGELKIMKNFFEGNQNG